MGEVTDQVTTATIVNCNHSKKHNQPPFGPSVDSLCHPWFTTTRLSYRLPIFETSATALCGTTGNSQFPWYKSSPTLKNPPCFGNFWRCWRWTQALACLRSLSCEVCPWIHLTSKTGNTLFLPQAVWSHLWFLRQWIGFGFDSGFGWAGPANLLTLTAQKFLDLPFLTEVSLLMANARCSLFCNVLHT